MLKSLRVDVENFEEIVFQNGVNLILGQKDSSDENYNSIGKTLLLRLIDFLLGASFKGNFNYVELVDKKVFGVFVFGGKEIEVARSLTNKNSSIEVIKSDFDELRPVDSQNITLSKWTGFLTQYYITGFPSSISFRQFSNVFTKFELIDKFPDGIKSESNKRSDVFNKIFSNLLNLELNEEISNPDILSKSEDKAVSNLSRIVDDAISNVSLDCQEPLEDGLIKIENISKTLQIEEIRLQQNKRYLRIYNDNISTIENSSPKEFKLKFDIYGKEVGDLLKKNYDEAFKFHSDLLSENKSKILEAKEVVEKKIKEIEERIKEYISKRDEIRLNVAKIISNSFSNDTGTLILLKDIISGKNGVSILVKGLEKKRKKEHSEKLQGLLSEDGSKIKDYEEFLRTNMLSIYPEGKGMEFSISLNKESNLKLEFNITNDSGHGVSSIRTLLFLLLLLKTSKANSKLDFFLLDSLAIESIDSDSFTKFLIIADEFCKSNEIQFICSANVQNINLEKIQSIYHCKILSPTSKLFGTDLTTIN